MTVVVVPDLPGAQVLHLLDESDIAALVGPRVSLQFQGPRAKNPWPERPTYAIRLAIAGGPSPQYDTDRHFLVLDHWCYGSTGYNAGLLCRTVQGYMIPPRPRSVGWRGHGVVVYEVQQLGAPIDAIDDDVGGWPARVVSFLFDYSGVLSPP